MNKVGCDRVAVHRVGHRPLLQLRLFQWRLAGHAAPNGPFIRLVRPPQAFEIRHLASPRASNGAEDAPIEVSETLLMPKALMTGSSTWPCRSRLNKTPPIRPRFLTRSQRRNWQTQPDLCWSRNFWIRQNGPKVLQSGQGRYRAGALNHSVAFLGVSSLAEAG